jgi:hypothetical protein
LKLSRSRGRLLLFVILAGVLVVSAVLWWWARNRNRQITRGDSQVQEILVDIDYELSMGYYRKALEGLNRAVSAAQGEYNLLRVLKRAYAISDNLKDSSVFLTAAREAWEKIPGSKDLAKAYLFSAIRSQLDPAGRTLLSGATSDRDIQYLQVEAYLRGSLAELPLQRREGALEELLSLTEQRDPVELQRQGTRLDEPRLYLDAALLWMKEGQPGAALAALERYPDNTLFVEPGIYIAYDAGYGEKALRYLHSHPEAQDRSDLLIMEADLNLLLGNRQEAVRLYRRIISVDPDYSWVPYLNLAGLVEADGDEATAHHFRQIAFQSFPETAEVVLSYAQSLSRRSGKDRAAELVVKYLEWEPGDIEANLLLLDLKDTASSPALYEAALWKLFNQFPGSRKLCETLFLYLLEFNDLEGAEAVLRHYELAAGGANAPWFLDYRAVLAALGRNYSTAVALIRKRLVVQDSWRARYNLALILAEAGQAREAIDELIAAENALTAGRQSAPQQEPAVREQQNSFRSRIRSKIGEQYLALGDETAARRECEYALDLDVSNFHAHRILRILAGE